MDTPKVIGFDDTKFKTVTCRNCAAVVKYTRSHTVEVIERDYTGASENVTKLECPNCHYKMAVTP